MAKTSAPLLSFGARGSIGKTMVASSWRGINYMRQHVVPANPQTVAQQTVRTTFALLREMWKLAPTQVLAPWNAFAAGRPFTGMNKYVGENIRVLNGEPDMANFIASPGAKGGLPPVSFSTAAGLGSGEVVCTFVVPTGPAGWTLTAAVACAFPDQDPSGIFQGPFVAGSDSTAPWEVTLTGLTEGVLNQCCGWLVWTKPDGTLAYSVSLSDPVTP